MTTVHPSLPDLRQSYIYIYCGGVQHSSAHAAIQGARFSLVRFRPYEMHALHCSVLIFLLLLFSWPSTTCSSRLYHAAAPLPARSCPSILILIHHHPSRLHHRAQQEVCLQGLVGVSLFSDSIHKRAGPRHSIHTWRHFMVLNNSWQIRGPKAAVHDMGHHHHGFGYQVSTYSCPVLGNVCGMVRFNCNSTFISRQLNFQTPK